MYEGDRSRKSVLVEHGFRLPSAMDNRPLRFDEYMEMTKRRVYVSATPGAFEIVNSRPDNPKFIPVKSRNENDFDPSFFKRLNVNASGSAEDPADFDVSRSGGQLIVEQIIRPTGLLDPILTLRPLKDQIDETIELCQQRVEKGERVLITTLTKKTAEDLTEYLQGVDLKVRYIHSDVDAIERVEILRALRAAEFDILVGINLLREGLDLPEVSLVCILDADKEGFLRNETSLIQTAGRAARHVNGECVLFCDNVTDSIQCLLDVTEYRRRVQKEYNQEHGVTPTSVKRAVQKSLHDREVSARAGQQVNTAMVAEDDMVFNAVEVIREMEEEIGVPRKLVTILEESEEWLYYDFPSDLKARFPGPYIGQRQKWFALRFNGSDSDVRLDFHTPEFDAWRWADLDEVTPLIIHFKRPVYEDVVKLFAKWTVPEKG